MNALQHIFRPLREGKHIIVLQGRDLRDFTVDEQGRIMPLLERLREEAHRKDLILLQYARSSGLTFDTSYYSEDQVKDINRVLGSLGIERQETGSEAEFMQVMRGLLHLVQRSRGPKFSDGTPMKFMILIEFAEHVAPNAQSAILSPEQIISLELASKLSKSLALRKSGHFVIFSEAQEGKLNELLSREIHRIRLPQPGIDEKKEFLKALKDRYAGIKTEPGLTDEIIVNITSNTPNRSLEEIFLAAYNTGSIITPDIIFKKKQDDIIALSEGTLEAVDTQRTQNQKLVGRNIERAMLILSKAAESIRTGSKGSFRNILLAGAPATGKTHLAVQSASMAKIQAFMLNSPKSSYVGESERKTKLMLSTLREQKGIGIIDELEMVLPMNRKNSENLDSGVTQNIMGQLQTFLSDSSLEGKVMLIATSNKPGNISAAMLSRWNVIPVLMPLRSDFPAIVQSIYQSMLPDGEEMEISGSDLQILADQFYTAGASARDIRDSLIAAKSFIGGPLSIRHLEYAARTVVPSIDRVSYIYSDYMALKYTRNYLFLPWWDYQNNKVYDDYVFPDYIAEILDDYMKIDMKKLNAKIQELERYANV